MTEAEWLACDEPDRLLRRSPVPLSARKRMLCGIACCYRIKRLLRSGVEYELLIRAEDFADGEMPRDEFVDRCRVLNNITAQFPYERRQAILAIVHLGHEDIGLVFTLAAVAAAYDLTGIQPPYGPETQELWYSTIRQEQLHQLEFIRDIFGNPFRPVALDPSWRTETAVALAREMYGSRDFSAMPILADALQDAGCDSDDVLDHCRGPGPHVRGCWVVDLVLEKE